MKKYHLYSIIYFYTSILRYINSHKEGYLILFKCEETIQDQTSLSDLVLIDD